MEFLKRTRYPGRFIVMGMDKDAAVAIYGVTGRSAASQARKYVRQGNMVVVVPTDGVALAAGNRDLLVYPAVIFFDNGFVVANGNQITKYKSDLGHDLKDELPEPDKYLTPRITGVVKDGSCALQSIRGTPVTSSTWEVPLEAGKGKMIMTYTGDDAHPTAYMGDPVAVDLAFGSADAAAQSVYDLLTPDYRVAVVAVYQKPGEVPEVAIKNRF
jgi:IMP cyclohydrolase